MLHVASASETTRPFRAHTINFIPSILVRNCYAQKLHGRVCLLKEERDRAIPTCAPEARTRYKSKAGSPVTPDSEPTRGFLVSIIDHLFHLSDKRPRYD